MTQNRTTYYITMATGEISQIPTAAPWDFKISANGDEIMELREYFDQNYSTDWQGFFRAHTPYVQYHHDPSNDSYDVTLQKIYKMVYELGDEEAKHHIKSQGIITNLGDETD